MTGGAAAPSFNEVESLGAKAARGAGLGWGQADDIGRAVRWLAAHGLDWWSPLLALLDDRAAEPRAAALIREADRAFAPAGGCRTAADTAGGLLLPLLAMTLFGRDGVLVLRWAGATLALLADGSVHASSPAPSFAAGAPLLIEAAAVAPALPIRLTGLSRPMPVPLGALRRLTAYADRTAVPASAGSRLHGAGGTRPDDD